MAIVKNKKYPIVMYLLYPSNKGIVIINIIRDLT